MSNFDDYDLRRGESSGRRRPANRTTGRPSGSRPAGRTSHSSYSNHSMDLDDEIELYEYGSQYGFEDDERPVRRSASSSARRASSSRSGSRAGSHSGSRSASRSAGCNACGIAGERKKQQNACNHYSLMV